MSVALQENEGDLPTDGFAAAEIARTNLTYEHSWSWQSIATWAFFLVWGLALVSYAIYLTR